MAPLREDLIHVAIRKFLVKNRWTLLAGQYPDGSDDELPCLNVMDPTLACDNSPDARRHSKNKLVPDLVAYRIPFCAFIEMKPTYSQSDESKLEELLVTRKRDTLTALDVLFARRETARQHDVGQLVLVPCLGFSSTAVFSKKSDFCYFLVDENRQVTFVGNTLLRGL